MVNVTFSDIDCEVVKCQYAENDQVALELVAIDSPGNREKGIDQGECVAMATSCLPGFPFREGQTVIKDYMENSGMLAALVGCGAVEMTGELAFSGHACYPVVDVRL